MCGFPFVSSKTTATPGFIPFHIPYFSHAKTVLGLLLSLPVAEVRLCSRAGRRGMAQPSWNETAAIDLFMDDTLCPL